MPKPPTSKRVIPRTLKAKVISELLAGAGVKKAAESAGIHRQRIWEWRRRDPEFQAMLEDAELQLREELVDEAVAEARARLRNLAPWAIVALETQVAKGNLKAVSLVLRHIEEFGPRQQIEVTGTLEARLAAIGDRPSD